MPPRPIDPAKLERAAGRVAAGERPGTAAAAEGVGRETLRKYLKAGPNPSKPLSPPDAPVKLAPAVIDTTGTPLEIVRDLMASVASDLANMPSDSPRRNPATAQLRAMTKVVADLERAAAAKETPEEVERRRRREDGDTLKRILWSVERAEKEAAAKGVCVHCGQSLPK